MAIGENTIVKINYKGTLDDGSVFDSNEGGEPLEFIFGAQMIIPGLEKELEGLNIGDKKKINVESKDAYGPIMEQAVQEVPKEQFPADIELKEGMQLAAQGPQGTIPVLVKEIKDNSVLVDFNHPLAGKNLNFDVEVIDVKEATQEEQERILGPIMEQQKQAQQAAEEAQQNQNNECANCSGNCDNKDSSLEDDLEKEEKKE